MVYNDLTEIREEFESNMRDEYSVHDFEQNEDGMYINRDVQSMWFGFLMAYQKLLPDASRYRWLRDNKHLDIWWSVSGPNDRCENIDMDIDEAIKETQPQLVFSGQKTNDQHSSEYLELVRLIDDLSASFLEVGKNHHVTLSVSDQKMLAHADRIISSILKK